MDYVKALADIRKCVNLVIKATKPAREQESWIETIKDFKIRLMLVFIHKLQLKKICCLVASTR